MDEESESTTEPTAEPTTQSRPEPTIDAAVWRTRGRAVLAFFNADRIVATIALLLIPCLFFAWVHVPVGNAAGLSISFSVPELVATGDRAITGAQNVAEVYRNVERVVDNAAAVLDWGTEKIEMIVGVLDPAEGESQGEEN